MTTMTKSLKWLAALLCLLRPIAAFAGFVHIISEDGSIDLRTDKVAHVTGSFDPRLAQSFHSEMTETASIAGDRLILIDSDGGITTYGDRMIRDIEKEKASGVRVVCYVAESAHSMAFNLLSHCNIRLAHREATMVVHRIEFYELRSDHGLNRLTARNLRKIADGLDRDDAPYGELNAKLMGLTPELYEQFTAAETTWTAEDLVQRHYFQDFADIVK